jgi:hypothetical protein
MLPDIERLEISRKLVRSARNLQGAARRCRCCVRHHRADCLAVLGMGLFERGGCASLQLTPIPSACTPGTDSWVQLGQLSGDPEATFVICGLRRRLAERPTACMFLMLRLPQAFALRTGQWCRAGATTGGSVRRPRDPTQLTSIGYRHVVDPIVTWQRNRPM